MLEENWIYLLQVIFLLRYCDTGDIKYHPAWKILDAQDCGESAADRIIGGKDAALGQFPWIVRLGYTENPTGKDLEWMCGGVLISKEHVVTAGHCLDRVGKDYFIRSVRMGEHDIRTDPDCQLGVCAPRVQDRRVKSFWIHESYQKPPFHNDIAIIKLEKPVFLNDYVMPVCLPRDAEQRSPLRPGEDITLAGWGTTNMTTAKHADVLQYIHVPVVNPSFCDHFGKNFNISASELCAGAQKDKDSCSGDSGGPAVKVFDTAVGPKNVLVGVVSFGPTQCGIKKPGVYTSIPYFLPWILNHVIVK